MKKGIEHLDTYLINNIASYLDLNDIKSFSQQNKDCAYSCALMCSQKYAECIATNQSIPLEVITVLRRVVGVEDEKELATSIVDKIFEISGSVLLRKTYRLPPVLMELMNEYRTNNLDQSTVYDTCRDIPGQVIQHIVQCCVSSSCLYTKKSSDAVHESKEDVVAAFIRNCASLYCLMATPDADFVFGQHKFIVARYEDIFLSPQNINAIRIKIKSIFDTAIDEVELVIDVGQRQSFPGRLDVNNIRWETDSNIEGGFPITIRRISIIGDRLTSVGSTFLSWCTYLTTVTIPFSVTSIRGYFLNNCTSLTAVTIPNSVTSIRCGFLDRCTSLTSLTLPDSVTSIGDNFLSGCSSLSIVTIPNSITSLEDFFLRECTSLTSVTIPDSVTSIGSYFLSRCTSLTSITIPDSVMSVGDYFIECCTSLTSITIPNSITSIGDYFSRECSRLTSIIIPDSVTSIGNYFLCNCTSVTSVTISISITSIGRSFLPGCINLTSIIIPGSVISIGRSFLKKCISLTSIIIHLLVIIFCLGALV